MKEPKELDLKFLYYVMKKWRWKISATVVICFIITSIISFFFIKPTYEARAKIFITVTESEDINLGSLNLNMQIMNTYREMLTTASFLQKVKDQLPQYQLTIKQLKENIDVTVVNETPLMSIEVKDLSLERSEEILNSLLTVIQDEIPKLSRLNDVVILESPQDGINESTSSSIHYMFIGIMLIVSFVSSLAISSVKEINANTLKKEDEIRQEFGIQTLSKIPKIQNQKYLPSIFQKKKSQNSYLITQMKSIPNFIQPFPLLYHALKNKRVSPYIKSLVVTSSSQGEGKSTIISNLGIMYALNHHKVLLIDGNVNAPTLHEIFDVPNEYGLMDILGKKDLNTALCKEIKETKIPNLSLLPAGVVSGSQLEVISQLSSASFSGLIKHALSQFDIILIDSPSSEEYFILQALAGAADGIVLIIEWDETKKKDFNLIVKQLQGCGTPLLGAVMNHVKET